MKNFIYGVVCASFASDTVFRTVNYVFSFAHGGLLGFGEAVFRDTDGLMYFSAALGIVLMVAGFINKVKVHEKILPGVSAAFGGAVLYLLNVSSPAGLAGGYLLAIFILLYVISSIAATFVSCKRAYHILKNT